MKIKIREDAGELYIKNNTDHLGNYYGNPKWEIILYELAGEILEVESESLLPDSFKTKPIHGLFQNGLIILKEYVKEVIDPA